MENVHVLFPIQLSELEMLINRAVEKTIQQAVEKAIEKKLAPKPSDELITREEAAELLRVTLPTLHNWTKAGRLPFYKIASRVRYKRADIEKLFESGDLRKFSRKIARN
jgi:excisionase family DNA binding protein